MNKCEGCQWYGKPYWSIINPCDNCTRKEVQTFTRWQDPSIKEYQKEIQRLNNIIDIKTNRIQRLMKRLSKRQEKVDRLNKIIDDKKERQDIAIRLLEKMFGTDDYEINYIIGVLNGQRQIHFEELKEKK